MGNISKAERIRLVDVTKKEKSGRRLSAVDLVGKQGKIMSTRPREDTDWVGEVPPQRDWVKLPGQSD